MGYRDYTLALSTSQNVTADAVSENYLDTEITYPGWTSGMPAVVVVTVEKVSTAGTGITFKILHKTSQPSTDVILCSVTALAADLTAGSTITIPLPQGITINRYLALYYDITAGTEDYTLSAYFTPVPAPM